MNSAFINDQILILALKNGDGKAYDFLVDTYHHKLCVYAFGLINDHDHAEDIVQNVFLRIWKNRNKLKEDLSVKNYLYRSVYNEFIDEYRKKKSILSIEKTYIEALHQVVEDDDNSLEKLITLVNTEIEKLPPKCKQTFLLSKKDGLTNIEIAEYLNISLKSVEAHITKAFGILRKTVGDKTNGILFLMFGTDMRLLNS